LCYSKAGSSPSVLFVIVVLISQAVKATEQLKQNENYEICFKHSGNESHTGRPNWRRTTRDLSSAKSGSPMAAASLLNITGMHGPRHQLCPAGDV
jgi:hypothetical protein